MFLCVGWYSQTAVIFKFQMSYRVLELSVHERQHFEKVNQKFILFMGLVVLPKAPKAKIVSNRVFSKRILTSIEGNLSDWGVFSVQTF